MTDGPCPEWCAIDGHTLIRPVKRGPCRPRIADHHLSPGGRIALAEVVDRHRDGHITHQSNRHGPGLGYIASGSAMVLEEHGLIQDVADPGYALRVGPQWRPTALGVALHEALEDEGR
jgi:hypothetical protein